ncbi:hypothetical protein L211DRAFT_852698 [Terfezia boudieri ATCC MYA-4762]|uniref:Uncharacterized protein n=1 Tax=Terfezia boudieri ATCC MYA-4762 TaxID=1051890 RepID=A0A3N4LEX3_9PEZI|nr:hypothetical protein L211DRAFT_852698 [Terfezia boudieri ATCC MYA-4762]
MVEPTIRISEKPSRDSYVEDNLPICNLGASGVPRQVEPGTPPLASKSEPADAQMANNDPASGEGQSHRTGEEIKTEAIGSSTPLLAPTQKETKAEIQRYEAETEAMIWKADTNLLLKTKTDIAELSVIARLVEAVKNKPSATRRSGKIQRNIQRTPVLVGELNGKFQELSRHKTPEKEDTYINPFLAQDIVEAEVTAAIERKEK